MARSELLPRLPTPNMPMVIRSLGGTCPPNPSAELGTNQGLAAMVAAPVTNRRRPMRRLELAVTRVSFSCSLKPVDSNVPGFLPPAGASRIPH